MESGKWKMENLKWRMENEKCKVVNGKWRVGKGIKMLRNCLKISCRENLSVEKRIYNLCLVQYGTKGSYIFNFSTDL